LPSNNNTNPQLTGAYFNGARAFGPDRPSSDGIAADEGGNA
jgi:hypothetical protein